MRLPADCFILYGTHSPLSSISVPDADRIHHPGPPPECRRAGSDPDSARRTSVVASDATLPRTLRPVGLAQRRWPAQGHGLPLALAQTPGPRTPGVAAAPASVGQSPAQSAATDQQHPFPHPALGESAASGQPYLEPGYPTPEL